jgi:integrase
MLLTATAIRNAKHKDKPLKLPDGAGLFLLVQPSGAKWWRFRYRFEGKEKMLSLGTYPEVSLKDARERRDDARKMLASGIDPSENRKAVKAARAETNSFEVVAREWLAKFSPNWAPTHTSKIVSRLEKDIFPWVKDKAIRDITAPDLLKCLRRIEERGALESAHRTLQHCGQVFRYAIVTGRADRDISADLRGALPPVKQKHHASITEPGAIGELLRAINGYQGSIITRCALQLAPLVFVRPGELRKAEWKELDLDKSEWRIPGSRMKMKEMHIVPLSSQAVEILRELQPLTGSGRYVFPGARTNGRPMSENAVTAALRRMGFTKDEMTGHGFRSMASTLLNEQGWNRDAIERQLAHAERNSIRAAYNYAQHMPERIKMMQAWADWLEATTRNNKVIPIKQAQ